METNPIHTTDPTTTTRAEHLDWCKKRALAYLDYGDWQGAFASMVSDLDKHPGTQEHSACRIGMMLILNGHLNDVFKMREFINGFR